jgi:curved DNA-binding protein CbpA
MLLLSVPAKAQMTRTHYEILGVPRTASEREIKMAYHRLARKYHPDKAGKEQSGEMEREFELISNAYNTLKDREKRAAYDRTLEGSSPPERGNAPTPPAQPAASADNSSGKTQSAAAAEKSRLSIARRAYLKGMQLFAAGDYARAAEYFEIAVKNHDAEALYHAKLALTLLRAKRSFLRATDAAKSAITLDPYNPDHRFVLAEIYEQAGSETMAYNMYEEILKWDPTNERALFARNAIKPQKRSLGQWFQALFGKH